MMQLPEWCWVYLSTCESNIWGKLHNKYAYCEFSLLDAFSGIFFVSQFFVKALIELDFFFFHYLYS